ncbi:hypothetical protein [Rugosimonospora africana]|uniref:hypothetical protein n=1 Tax=Rugosimonospora africana TaxID=556532 RepID=UPI001EF2F3C5|nr:hypothetical protein [Rugosimonospora africana]
MQDSAEDRAPGAGRERGPSSGRPVPEEQRSPFGPQPPANRRVQSGIEPEPDES